MDECTLHVDCDAEVSFIGCGGGTPIFPQMVEAWSQDAADSGHSVWCDISPSESMDEGSDSPEEAAMDEAEGTGSRDHGRRDS